MTSQPNEVPTIEVSLNKRTRIIVKHYKTYKHVISEGYITQ